MSDKQRKAMWARKSQNAMNSDLSKRADDVRPYSAVNHASLVAGGSRRFDIEGLDTPIIPKPKKDITEIKDTFPDTEKHIEKTTLKDNEIDEFYQTYPIHKLNIPSEVWDSGTNDEPILSVMVMNKKGNTSVIRKSLPDNPSEKEIKKTADILVAKGYLNSSIDSSGDTVYHTIDGGYAKYIADKKGKYGDYIYGEAEKKFDGAENTVKRMRAASLENITKRIEYLSADMDATKRVLEDIKHPAYRKHYEKEIKKRKKEITHLEKRADTLRAPNAIVLDGGTKKLQGDIKYILDEVMEIGNDDIKYITSPFLKIAYTKRGDADGMLRTHGRGDVKHYEMLIHERHRKANSRENDAYIDTLTHELVHFMRSVDARRAFLPDVMRIKGGGRQDIDSEEKETVMETTVRIGKHSHTGSKRGYYQFVKGIDNVALEDSKLLTMTPNGARHNSLKQVTEDMDVRHKTSPMHRLKYQGRSEWIDMFYTTGDTNYQLYTANPQKNFNPRNVAKQIDMEDGIRGNENIYEWRDGKKHLVIKKET